MIVNTKTKKTVKTTPCSQVDPIDMMTRAKQDKLQ